LPPRRWDGSSKTVAQHVVEPPVPVTLATTTGSDLRHPKAYVLIVAASCGKPPQIEGALIVIYSWVATQPRSGTIPVCVGETFQQGPRHARRGFEGEHHMRRSFLVVATALAALAPMLTVSAAPTYTVTRVAASSDDSYAGITDDQFVIWAGDQLAPGVFRFDTATSARRTLLPNGSVVQMNPRGDILASTGGALVLLDKASGASVNVAAGISFAHLSESGDVVWDAPASSWEHEIFLWDRGTQNISRLTNSASGVYNQSPSVGGTVVAWDVGWSDPLAGYYKEEIIRYDRATGSSVQLTNDDASDGAPRVNAAGDIVWGRTSSDGTSAVMLYRADSGEIMQLAASTGASQSVLVNSRGDVAWATMGDIYLYNRASGVVSRLTFTGDNSEPDLNDNGDMVWYGGPTWEIFAYDAASATIVQVTNTPNIWEYSPKVNAYGDIAWVAWDDATYSSPVEFAKRGTVAVTSARWRASKQELTVTATSNYGSSAALQLVGFGPMTWNPAKNNWAIVVPVPTAPLRVTVLGPEGSASSPVTN
jgi:hypothetical protein